MKKTACRPKVYLETSIPSYLASRPSNDLRVCANQNISFDWSTNRRHLFELYISELVIDESSLGDAEAAKRRLDLLVDIPLLQNNENTKQLATYLVEKGSLPAKARLDALHIAIATVHGIEYLLTWNCTHIANAIMRPRIEQACRDCGFEPPIICTPQELIEG